MTKVSNPKARVGIVGTGGEWSSLPVTRELGRQSCECHLLFRNLKSPTSFSRFVSGKRELPARDHFVLETIIEYSQAAQLTHLFCLDEDLKTYLIKERARLKELKFAFPSLESYQTALKKSSSTAFADSIGIPTPTTTNPDSLEELDSLEFDFSNPLVVKGVRGASSSHVRYAFNQAQLRSFYHEIYALEKDDPLASSLPIIQEYIGGSTYLTQTLSQEGKVKVVVPHEKLREWPTTGGVSSLARTINEPRLVEYSGKILESLEWHGEAGMEWKYDKERDDFYFIEMNPRFEGSLDLAVKADVNMPALLLDILDGKEIPDDISFEKNVMYRWFFRNDFLRFLKEPYGLGRMIKESFDPKIHGEVVFDDMGVLRAFLKPTIRMFVNYLRGR